MNPKNPKEPDCFVKGKSGYQHIANKALIGFGENLSDLDKEALRRRYGCMGLSSITSLYTYEHL